MSSSSHIGGTASIVGTGSYLPKHIMTNADLEKLVDTSDEWITSRTGIKERRIAAVDEFTNDMATSAAQMAISSAGISAEEIDVIICATVTPDMLFPNTACCVQMRINAYNAICFDISVACSGFLFGLEIARKFIFSGEYKTILVIGADKLSEIVDWTDRNTCVLFGDGAGAAILQHRPNNLGILKTKMGSNGHLSDVLYIPYHYKKSSISKDDFKQKIRMNGRETYKHAVTSMVDAIQYVLADLQIAISDISCFIPHQANLRIIEAIAQRLHFPMDRIYINLHRYGNTSAAAVAIALDEATRSGLFQKGDKILMAVFGGGLTWGATVVEW